MDGTLIQSVASLKSFRPRDEGDEPPTGGANAWADFKGEERRNDTHECKTDLEARLYRKGNGREALLFHSLHALMENRSSIPKAIEVAEANGKTERQAAIRMLKH